MKSQTSQETVVSKPKTNQGMAMYLSRNFPPYNKAIEILKLHQIEVEADTLIKIHNKLSEKLNKLNVSKTVTEIPLIAKTDYLTKAYSAYENIRGTFKYESPEIKQFTANYISKPRNMEKFTLENLLLHPLQSEDNVIDVLRSFITFNMTLLYKFNESKLEKNEDFNSFKNEIYQTISNEVVIPYLTKCFAILQNEDSVSESADLFDMIILLASDYRGKIAAMQIDPNAANMGKFLRDSSLRDPLEAPNYKPWKDKIVELIKQAIVSESKEVTLNYQGLSKCPNVNYHDLQNSLKGVWHSLEDNDIIDNNIHAACYHFTYSSFTDLEKVPGNLSCLHTNFTLNQIEVLNADLKQIILADKDLLAVKGSNLFAEFLWDISHGSFLYRGQAAVTEYIMKALASAKGLLLSWSTEWTPPQHPSYDMQALSILDKQVFIKDHSHNIILTEIIDDAVLAGEIEGLNIEQV